MKSFHKIAISALLVMMSMSSVHAQGVVPAQKGDKAFTLEDLNFGGNNYRNMVAKNRWATWWGDQLVRQDIDACYLVNKANGKETKLFSLNEINQWIAPTKDIKVRALYNAEFPFADKSIVKVQNGSKIYTIDFKKHRLVSEVEFGEGENLLEANAQQTAYAYLKGSNLCVRVLTGTSGNANTKEKKSHDFQLSQDGSREIVYGQSVHRDEFGISKGTFWSPSGEKLAFYRMDQSMVTDYPQVNIPEIDDFNHPETQSCIATPAPDKYPMTGETSHKVTVGVFDCTTGKTIYLKAGDPTDRYFTNIAWSPDNKVIYMFELNRDQNDCRLVSYNAETGDKIAELYRETDEKYVEPLHPIQFLPWNSNQFIMQSQKDGYNHLYICTLKGGKAEAKGLSASDNASSIEMKQLTSGKWVVMDVLGFYPKHKSIIIASNECSPIQRNIFLVDAQTGKRAMMDDNGKGWHNATLSESGKYLYDNYSTPTVPRKIAIVNMEIGDRTPYFTAENPWKGYNVPEYSCGTIKAADGETDLYWRMVKPVNFDPNKKYPTIIYVYGGPHLPTVGTDRDARPDEGRGIPEVSSIRGCRQNGRTWLEFRWIHDHLLDDQLPRRIQGRRGRWSCHRLALVRGDVWRALYGHSSDQPRGLQEDLPALPGEELEGQAPDYPGLERRDRSATALPHLPQGLHRSRYSARLLRLSRRASQYERSSEHSLA